MELKVISGGNALREAADQAFAEFVFAEESEEAEAAKDRLFDVVDQIRSKTPALKAVS